MKKVKHTRKHDTLGIVGAKEHFCFNCKRIAENFGWEEEIKELEYARKHPKAKTPVATALRRIKQFKEGKGKFITLKQLEEKLAPKKKKKETPTQRKIRNER